MNAEKKTLWTNRDRSRTFLIPEGADLPPGDFELRTITGRGQRVIEEELTPYEVSTDEARKWLGEQLGEVLTEAKTEFLTALGEARQRSRERAEATLDALPAETRQSQAETLEALARGLEQITAAGSERLRELARNLRESTPDEAPGPSPTSKTD